MTSRHIFFYKFGFVFDVINKREQAQINVTCNIFSVAFLTIQEMLGASPRLHQHQDTCKVSKVFLSKMFLSKT